MIDATSVSIFREIIIANELAGLLELAYRFSDPDGVRTGKSGYSFGVCQFDILNNPSAVLCLRECGFVTDEIRALREQSCPVAPLNAKLATATSVVDAWDERQLHDCLTHPANLCRESGVRFGCSETLYHVADYHNQFYMSKGGKLHRFLAGMKCPVMPEDIRGFKMALPWGRKRPDDVARRFGNIARIVRSRTVKG